MSVLKTTEIRFLGKVFLFLFPLTVIFGLPVAVLYRSGEFLSNDAMVLRHLSDPRSLVGMEYSNPIYYVSLKSTLLKFPQVLILGSSRVSTFRSGFFKNPDGVYIASPVIHTMSQFENFIEKIPSAQSPRLLLIALDHDFFNRDYDATTENIDASLTEPVPLMDIVVNWSLVYRDYAEGKFSLRELVRPQSSLIGIAAISRGAGIRNDGSYERGKAILVNSWKDPSSARYQFRFALSEIETGTGHFGYGSVVLGSALRDLDELLAEAKARNIYVVGFVPPIAPTIYSRIMALPDRYGYLSGIRESAQPIFKKYGFGFFDFLNPQSLRVSDEEMDDDIHATERGSAITFMTMAKSDPVLRQYADHAFLEKRLRETDGQFYLFETGPKTGNK